MQIFFCRSLIVTGFYFYLDVSVSDGHLFQKKLLIRLAVLGTVSICKSCAKETVVACLCVILLSCTVHIAATTKPRYFMYRVGHDVELTHDLQVACVGVLFPAEARRGAGGVTLRQGIHTLMSLSSIIRYLYGQRAPMLCG